MQNQDKNQPSQGGLQEMDGETIDHNKLGTAEEGQTDQGNFDPEIAREPGPTADTPDVATSITGGVGAAGEAVGNGPEDRDRLVAGGTEANMRPKDKS